MKAVKVKLSKRRQAELKRLEGNPAAQKQLRDSWLNDVVVKNTSFAEFVAKQNARPLEFGITPNGAVYVKGSGTRHNFVTFTPERSGELLARIAEFQATLKQASAKL